MNSAFPGGFSRPSVPTFVGVVIPAYDEQQHVGRAVRSVCHTLQHHVLAATNFWIVVADDASSDATALMARRALGSHGEVLSGDFGTAGAARHAGFDRLLALATDRGGLDNVWLATTDADSRVPLAWIADHLQWWRDGFDAVAGMVEPEWDDDVALSLRRRYAERMIALGTGHGHPHVYGANLGFTADAYVRAGGMPTTPTGEDHQLWAELRATGARVVSSADTPVVTSARQCGRAPAGFAALLASLAVE